MWDEIRKVYPPPSSSAAPLGKTHSTNENRIFVTSDKIRLFAVFKFLTLPKGVSERNAPNFSLWLKPGSTKSKNCLLQNVFKNPNFQKI